MVHCETQPHHPACEQAVHVADDPAGGHRRTARVGGTGEQRSDDALRVERGHRPVGVPGALDEAERDRADLLALRGEGELAVPRQPHLDVLRVGGRVAPPAAGVAVQLDQGQVPPPRDAEVDEQRPGVPRSEPVGRGCRGQDVGAPGVLLAGEQVDRAQQRDLDRP